MGDSNKSGSVRLRSSPNSNSMLLRNIFDLPRPLFAVLIFVMSLVFVLPIFNQGDLNHTVVSSYAYLKGNIFNFYDYNQPILWGNDYLPILYLIFALWMAPYFYSGLPVASELIGPFALQPGEIAVLSPGEIIWAKLLLVLFFFASVLLLYRIAKLIHPHNLNSQSVVLWSYVLSPFALISFGVFSQYDIMGVVFTLWAVLMFLQKRMLAFAVLIGVALTFKFFAGLLVAPLLLLGNKRIRDIVGFGLIAAAPVILQFAMYWSNEAFRGRIFTQLISKSGGAATSWEAYAAVLAYVAICVSAYYSNYWKGTFEQKTVFFIVSSYGILLSVVVWHPQWVIILTPFIALVTGFLARPWVWLLWESIAFAAFVGYTVTYFIGNVDGTMIQKGALSTSFPQPGVTMASLFPPDLTPLLLTVTELFFVSAGLVLLFRIFRKSDREGKVPGLIFTVRSLTIWAAFIVPAFIAVYSVAAVV
jgi:hypothetical protein